jgi:hypothetical protein
MVWFILVFSGVFMFCRFMCESGETASNPPRLRSFFFASGAWLVGARVKQAAATR